MDQVVAKTSKAEVRRALKKMKSGKAAGPDIEVEVQLLTRSFKRC